MKLFLFLNLKIPDKKWRFVKDCRALVLYVGWKTHSIAHEFDEAAVWRSEIWIVNYFTGSQCSTMGSKTDDPSAWYDNR